MKLTEFDYPLPKNLIAQHARAVREKACLLILDRTHKTIMHTVFKHIIRHVHEGDVIVLNNTRVFKARIPAHKQTGGSVDILLTNIVSADRAIAMVSRAKRISINTRLNISDTVHACVREKHGSQCTLCFNVPVTEIIAQYGTVPLPHYIKRQPTQQDEHDYQTVYAGKNGSIAAPTAGLHFTEKIITDLRQKGVLVTEITLHIGPGTFKPIRSEHVEEHTMDAEYYEIPKQTLQMIEKAKRVIGVGTSVCRALETYARSGKRRGMADLFIYPGHEFTMIDALITNFHMPCSTPLVLVSAFAGKDLVFQAYEQAIEKKYRFLSYGDAMFII